MKSGRKGQRFILSLIVCCILLCNTAFAGTWEYRIISGIVRTLDGYFAIAVGSTLEKITSC